jgi:hypothetical protein
MTALIMDGAPLFAAPPVALIDVASFDGVVESIRTERR